MRCSPRPAADSGVGYRWRKASAILRSTARSAPGGVRERRQRPQLVVAQPQVLSDHLGVAGVGLGACDDLALAPGLDGACADRDHRVAGLQQPVDQPAVGAFERHRQPGQSAEPAQAGNEVVEPGCRVGTRKARTVVPVWSSTQTAGSVDAQSIPTNISTTSWKLAGQLGEEESAGWSLTGARGACLDCRSAGPQEAGARRCLAGLKARPTLAGAPALTEPYTKTSGSLRPSKVDQ
jgi:hypothetical protein